MNTQPYELRDVREVFADVENAVAGLEELPRLLQLLIDNYNLDSAELTENERFDLGMASNTLYSVLYIVQSNLYTMSDKLRNISIKKDLDQEDTETAK